MGNWYYYYDTDFGSTGGGGGGHGAEGQHGEDRLNSAAGVTEGVGKACTQYGAPYSLYIPLRGGAGFSLRRPHASRPTGSAAAAVAPAARCT